MEKIKEEYEKLRKKHNLPKFEDFDGEFELRCLDVDKCGILIKAILRLIMNKLGNFLGVLDPVVNPNPQTLHSLIELSNLDENGREEIIKHYKDVSFIYHQAYIYELKNEDDCVKFIKNLWGNWPKIKEKQVIFLQKITDSWSK